VFSDDSVDHVIESESDSSDISDIRNRVLAWLEERTVVVGLPAVNACPSDKPQTRSKRTPIKPVDRAARAKYMIEWQRNARAKRKAALENARITPRRSQRLCRKRV